METCGCMDVPIIDAGGKRICWLDSSMQAVLG